MIASGCERARQLRHRAACAPSAAPRVRTAARIAIQRTRAGGNGSRARRDEDVHVVARARARPSATAVTCTEPPTVPGTI